MARYSSRRHDPRKDQSQLRIIGGQWRSRKLTFSPAPGLRPTSDRIRETLFNWLAPWIPEARCADLFAGSGALGLEALSRGAARCDFIDNSPAVASEINSHLSTLDAQGRGTCFSCEALTYLQKLDHKLDIVFIDPPFGLQLIPPIIDQLAASPLLTQQSLVYIETAKSEPVPETPDDWTLLRDKTAGDVRYQLYRAGPT